VELEAWRGPGSERGKRGGGGSGDLNREPSCLRTQPTADQPSHVVLSEILPRPTDIEAERRAPGTIF
jgi:hypothetical protein